MLDIQPIKMISARSFLLAAQDGTALFNTGDQVCKQFIIHGYSPLMTYYISYDCAGARSSCSFLIFNLFKHNSKIAEACPLHDGLGSHEPHARVETCDQRRI